MQFRGQSVLLFRHLSCGRVLRMMLVTVEPEKRRRKSSVASLTMRCHEPIVLYGVGTRSPALANQ
jgi:hypothetical protein